jgi:hypothetical protein
LGISLQAHHGLTQALRILWSHKQYVFFVAQLAYR